MTSKPPYTITENAADYLAKITESVTRLEFGTGFNQNIQLHRENRIRTIHSSLAIEGNTLTVDEVASVVGGKLVAGKQADIKEVKNAYQAYDQIMTFDPYSIDDFLAAHKLMTSGLIKESGLFRSRDVGVFDGDEVIHMGARPEFVSGLMEELFAWAKASDLHPLLKSGILHYAIETIHPFADGNGRMGRLWQTLLLSKWNKLFSWIPMESVVYAKRPEYYQAIKISRAENDSGPFIEYTLGALYASVLEQIASSDEPINEPINEREQHVLDHLRKNSRATKEQIAAAAGLSRSSVTRHIQALTEKGMLRRVGSNKTGYWEIVSR